VAETLHWEVAHRYYYSQRKLDRDYWAVGSCSSSQLEMLSLVAAYLAPV
jgi:hypothetical protein